MFDYIVFLTVLAFTGFAVMRSFRDAGDLAAVVSILAAIALFVAAIGFASNPTLVSANKVLNKCERSLPRDQHCVLVAIPAKRE
jgi:uncharacterized membrane protein